MVLPKLGSKERLAQSQRFEEEYKKDRAKSEKLVAEKVGRLRALRVAKEAADKTASDDQAAAIVKSVARRKSAKRASD